MKNIVYLFGAGASCKALPIVKDMSNRMALCRKFFMENKYPISSVEIINDKRIKFPKALDYYREDIIRDLSWMIENTRSHASVDTFAKKLSIQNDRASLNRLKIILSVFFVFEQANNNPDQRYDTFFASIHNSLFEFPKNIKILSWNYDYQFELTYKNFAQLDLHGVQRQLNINHKYGEHNYKEGFGIFKLNGTTGFSSDQGFNQYSYVTDMSNEINQKFMEDLVKGYMYVSNIDSNKSTFSFAWEKEASDDKKNLIHNALLATANAHVLVVIGYSFPFFNREIDRKIVNNMGDLESVYFQSPNPEELQERFFAVYDGQEKFLVKRLVRNCDQFVLPNEL